MPNPTSNSAGETRPSINANVSTVSCPRLSVGPFRRELLCSRQDKDLYESPPPSFDHVSKYSDTHTLAAVRHANVVERKGLTLRCDLTPVSSLHLLCIWNPVRELKARQSTSLHNVCLCWAVFRVFFFFLSFFPLCVCAAAAPQWKACISAASRRTKGATAAGFAAVAG